MASGTGRRELTPGRDSKPTFSGSNNLLPVQIEVGANIARHRERGDTVVRPLGARGADLVACWQKGFYARGDEAVSEIVAAFEQGIGEGLDRPPMGSSGGKRARERAKQAQAQFGYA